MKGPTPQPTAIRRLKNNPGKRPLNDREPVLPALQSSASRSPKRLGRVAAREWTRLYDCLVTAGILTIGDRKTFEQYCYVIGQLTRYENASLRVSAAKAVELGLIRAAASLRAQYLRLSERLGLDPASRSRLKVNPGKQADEEGEEERFFGSPASSERVQ